MKPFLRLLISRVNPETLGQFDMGTIVKKQQVIALLMTSILYICADIDAWTEPDVDNKDHSPHENIDLELGNNIFRSAGPPHSCNHQQIVIVSLCILYYIQNQQSNLLQMTTDYYAYADNTTKRMVENLHYMGLMIIYETVR